ncbi:hypothetical protein FIBSPDRAFT_948779 [Athelia psychrophila]|uniref:Uncharacterized protein n=1 Tax=Athelia psychrophila TaxID=1759441 RepID=A0A166QGG5_9AGAM|nr:hypothetical protein FIBSPDRAFT_948779 [Fibularhizoctonia sp. CBS 109695]
MNQGVLPYRVKFLSDGCSCYRPGHTKIHCHHASVPDPFIRNLQQHCPLRILRCRPLHPPLRHIQAFLLLSGTSPVRGTPPYPTLGSSGMSRVYGSPRPSRRPVARVGPNKVVFEDASSGKNAYSLHQFGKTAVYKAVQTIYAPHYASNHLAFFQPEIHGFTHGLVKACIDPRQRNASPFAPAEMSRSPGIVAKLQAELDASIPEPLAIPDIRVLQHLPYLSPLIQDGLRVHGAVPSLPERVIPSHLQKQLGPCTRDPTAFPPALTFLPDPDRWLSAIEDQLAQIQAHFMPFPMGSWIWGNHARDDDDASLGTLRSMRRKG